MANLNELIADVYTITNRPDLVAETLLEIKSATLKAHRSDFYAKDIFEAGIEWNTPAYIQSLAYRDIIPRWRALKFLRKYTADGVAGQFFTPLTPEATLDSYGVNKENVCYLAGEMLEIRSTTQDRYMLLGCYIDPDITAEGYSSWVARSYPYMIVYEAARKLFKMIGFDEQAAQMNQLVAEELAVMRATELATTGF